MLGKCPCVPALRFSLRDSHFPVGQRRHRVAEVSVWPHPAVLVQEYGKTGLDSYVFFNFICFAAHLMTWTLNVSCSWVCCTALGSNLWANSDPYPHNNSALQPCFGKSCPKSMPPFWAQTKSGYFFLSCHPRLGGLGQKMPRISEELFPIWALQLFWGLRSRNPRLWKGRGKAKGWFDGWWGGRRDTK